jgi:hypothetical protein
MKTIVIDGVEYELVPVKKEESSLVEEYEGVKMAQPKPYDWKEELAKKRKKNMQNSILRKIPRQDSEMDKFGKLVIGEGIRQDL